MPKTDPEVPMSDPELDSLMAELEAETAGTVAAPAATAATPPEPDPVIVEDELDDAEIELQQEQAQAEAEQPAPQPEPVAEPPKVARAPLKAVAPTPAPAPAPAPAPSPVVEATAPAAMASKPEPDPNAKPQPVPGLKFHIDVAQFRAETDPKMTDLDNAMIEQSGLRAYYHSLAAQSEAQEQRLKDRFKVKEAELYDKHRKALALTGEKVTEKMVENAVLLDPQWIRMKNMVTEAGTIANINRGLVDSLRDRASMLVQLGADRREEGKGQLRIMQDQDIRQRAIDAARR